MKCRTCNGGGRVPSGDEDYDYASCDVCEGAGVTDHNRGWRFNRTKTCPRELAFSELWSDECKPRRWLNSGFGTIQGLFIHTKGSGLFGEREVIARITMRDRMIVATIVQWLGSNVGFEFLRRALLNCGYKITKVEEKK